MKYYFENVFYRKSEGVNCDEFVNSTYWILLFTTNILKWIYAATLISDKNNYILLILLFIFPIIKFLAIGLGNIKKFSQKFKHFHLRLAISIILFIESFFEMPCHILFPRNHIYLHTNYFKIYDIAKYRQIEIISEITENFFILISLFYSFTSRSVGIVSILTLSFSLVIFIYFIIAEFFYMFIAQPEEIGKTDEYGRRLKNRFNEEKNGSNNIYRFELKRDRYIKNISDDLGNDSASENNVDIAESRKVENNDHNYIKYIPTIKSIDRLNN